MPFLDDAESSIPSTVELLDSYPNPFNSSTVIRYNLSHAGPVKLAIYDIQGREVAVLHDSFQNAGLHQATWNGSNLSSGVYFCRMVAGEHTAMIKLVMVR